MSKEKVGVKGKAQLELLYEMLWYIGTCPMCKSVGLHKHWVEGEKADSIGCFNSSCKFGVTVPGGLRRLEGE